jgi:thymidine kinase
MFSGKSSAARYEALRYAAIGVPVLTVTHAIDTRYGNGICTHDGRQIKDIPLIACHKLADVLSSSEWEKCQVCVIDEAQFFPDLYEVCKEMIKIKKNQFINNNTKKIKIIVAGLDMDSDGNPFGDVVKLGLESHHFSKLRSLCAICQDGTRSNFSQKYISDNKDQIEVGGSDKYRPVCEYYFHNPPTNKDNLPLPYRPYRQITLILGARKSGKTTLINKLQRESKITNTDLVFYDDLVATEENVDAIISEKRSVVVSAYASVLEEASIPLIRLASRATELIQLHALCKESGDLAYGDIKTEHGWEPRGLYYL